MRRARGDRRAARRGRRGDDQASMWRAAARTVPLGRLGREAERAWLVALAASPLGRALSGSVITLDGARANWSGPWPPPWLLRRLRHRAHRGARPTGLTAAPGAAIIGLAAVRAKCCGCTEAFQASRAGSIPVARSETDISGEWRSLVAHPAGGRAVAGSNPVSPTQVAARNAACATLQRGCRPVRPHPRRDGSSVRLAGR